VSIFNFSFEFACRFPGPLCSRPGPETARFTAVPNQFAARNQAIRDGGRRPASAARRRGRPPRPPERIRAGTGPGTGAVARGRTACPFTKADQAGQAVLPPNTLGLRKPWLSDGQRSILPPRWGYALTGVGACGVALHTGAQVKPGLHAAAKRRDANAFFKLPLQTALDVAALLTA